MNVRLLSALTLAMTSPAWAQFDADAPEPLSRLRGRLFLVGAEHADGFREAFFAGCEEQGRVVLLGAPGVDPEPLLASWREIGGERIELLQPERRSDADDDSARELVRGSAGVWFLDAPARVVATMYRGTAVERELRDLLARGGSLGAHGDAARALSSLAVDDAERGVAPWAGLDLVPGALVEPALASDGARSDRLASAMQTLPMLVGLGLRPTGSLVLQDRWLASPTSAWAWVAASDERELRVVELRSGGRQRPADLVALSRSAIARHVRPWPPADPPAPRIEHGTLMLGGGPMPPGTLERFIEYAGGPDAPIVYVPCLYEEQVQSGPGFLRSLRASGAKNVTWIHTKDRRLADEDEDFLRPLVGARGIWFGGGRQWNFVDSYQHTEAHRLMHAILERGGVIGGSSAGASIQTDYMARGNPLGNLDIMAEGYEEGLGFLTGVAVDQHFTQRGRLPDLTSLVQRWPQYLGIGIDEGAVLIVRGTVGEVLGSAVHVVDGRTRSASGSPTHSILKGGTRYDLAARRVLEKDY